MGDIANDGTNQYLYDSEGRVCAVIRIPIRWATSPTTAPTIANDGTNQYLYDSEGRVCAVISTPVPGFTTKTGYLYDAAGNRIAKGTITTMSCDPAQSGFQLTETYVVGPGGEEMTMFDGSGHWQRTNVYGAGRQLATYDQNANGTLVTTPVANAALHFQLIDSLGTPGSPTTGLRRWGGRRMQTTATGQPETDIQSLPFGNGLNPYPDLAAPGTADDATPLHFTGKERDAESGNDYFGARYYASSLGRFLSADPSGLAYADPANPQQLNLYSYVANNPLTFIDPTGKVMQMSCYTDPDTTTFSTDSNGNVTSKTTAGAQHCQFWDDGQGYPNLPKQMNTPLQLTRNLALKDKVTCSALQAYASQLGRIFDQVSDSSGWTAFGAGTLTVLAGLGEGPTAGLDTPGTITAGAVTEFFSTVSLVTGGIGATLDSYGNGNNGALTNFDTSQIVNAAATAAASRIPVVKPWAARIGDLAGKASDLAKQEKGGCL